MRLFVNEPCHNHINWVVLARGYYKETLSYSSYPPKNFNKTFRSIFLVGENKYKCENHVWWEYQIATTKKSSSGNCNKKNNNNKLNEKCINLIKEKENKKGSNSTYNLIKEPPLHCLEGAIWPEESPAHLKISLNFYCSIRWENKLRSIFVLALDMS